MGAVAQRRLGKDIIPSAKDSLSDRDRGCSDCLFSPAQLPTGLPGMYCRLTFCLKIPQGLSQSREAQSKGASELTFDY
jgi:hypothetical protein